MTNYRVKKVDIDPKKVSFTCIQYGECFKYNEYIYKKFETKNKEWSAVCISDSSKTEIPFTVDELVHRVYNIEINYSIY
jgi:hypothetical protein